MRAANSPARQEADSWRTIPNLITALRILLIVPFCYFAIHGEDLAALVVFFLAGVSDALDGAVARWLNQMSKFGRLVDPVADKVLTGIAYVVLSAFRETGSRIPLWVMFVVVTRDVLILVGCAVIYRIAHSTSFKPTVFGKLNTLIELLVIGWFLTAREFPVVGGALPTLYIVMTISVIVSFAIYTRQGLAMLQTAD